MSEDPIRIGHPDDSATSDICGCCDGTAAATLQPTENRPALSAIAFRAGDHGRFKASMLAHLATADHPALLGLGTRADDDFTIALIDAWASACDVLTFYQERLANEAYMGTATERLSIGELARLIGYRLHPGSSAETDIVFLMEDPPAAVPDVADLLVPDGTRVQSQPGPDEVPQTFETIEPLQARVLFNTLRPQLAEMQAPDNDDLTTWLEGTPPLQVGDAILIVGRDRSEIDTGSELWDFRRLVAVAPDAENNRTKITWDRPLGSVTPPGLAAQADHQFYHLPERAALFGYNAPHPNVLSEDQRTLFGDTGTPADNPPSPFFGTIANPGDWVFDFPDDSKVWLDAIYKSFVKDSWIVLARNNGQAELYRILDARDDGVSRYGISGKASLLTLDTDEKDTDENLLDFDRSAYRRTSVYGGSVEYPLARTPIEKWVGGSEINLNSKVDGLPEGRKLMFQGPRARLVVEPQLLLLVVADAPNVTLARGDIVTLMAHPITLGPGTFMQYDVVTDLGVRGTITAPKNSVSPHPAPQDAEIIAEAAVLKSTETISADVTRLVLDEPLVAAFDRTGLRIHANVARAAHGSGVTDILGSGDPSRPFQKFQLKQNPVTHRAAPTETGVASTLSLRIDGVEWQEVPDLYDRSADARVYKTSLTDSGETVIEFGDGISGARPSPGRDNIVADHSQGIGLEGNLRVGQLSLPVDRPLGLKETTNPLPATGGDDPEAAEDARRNAPIYTLTLGRVVSLTDYQDFALGFPGIAKAESRWVWQGETRRIMVTVAGPNGAEIPEDSLTYSNLLNAFRALGDPLVSVSLLGFVPATFRLGLRVSVFGEYDPDVVLNDTEAALRAKFSFDQRDFGQVLALSEIAAAAHEVTGVQAIDVDLLYRTEPPQTANTAHARLVSQPSRLGSTGTLLPAEILMLAPGPLDKLELMP